MAIASLSALTGNAAWACDSATCSLVTRGRGGLLPRHALQLDLSFRDTQYDTRMVGSHTVDELTLPKVNLERQVIVPGIHNAYDGHERFTQADLGYGLGTNVTAFASLPLIASRVHDVGHFGFNQRYQTWGLGDLLVGVRTGTPLRGLTAGLALKAPTGPYTLRGDYDGSILDPRFQPGTGSWDVVGAANFDRLPSIGRTRLALTVSYQWTGTNPLEYRFGPTALAAITATRPLGSRVTGSLQAKLFHQGRSELAGLPVPSTGATFLYLSPGATLRMPASLSLYGYLQVLPYRRVNEGQLAPSIAFMVGVSRMF